MLTLGDSWDKGPHATWASINTTVYIAVLRLRAFYIGGCIRNCCCNKPCIVLVLGLGKLWLWIWFFEQQWLRPHRCWCYNKNLQHVQTPLLLLSATQIGCICCWIILPLVPHYCLFRMEVYCCVSLIMGTVEPFLYKILFYLKNVSQPLGWRMVR